MRVQNPGGSGTVTTDGVTIGGNGTLASPIDQIGAPLTFWSTQFCGGTDGQIPFTGTGGNNFIALFGFVFTVAVKLNKIVIPIAAADAVNLYDIGLYTAAGALACHQGAATVPSTGVQSFPMTGGPITLPPGRYYLATTGQAATAEYFFQNNATGLWSFLLASTSIATTGGVLNSTITPPADSLTGTSAPMFAVTV